MSTLLEASPAFTPEEGLATADIDPYQVRAFEVEQAIDPDHTLPDVRLVPNPTRIQKRAWGTLAEEDFLIMQNGQPVGHGNIGTDKVAKERWFNGITVDKSGVGLGSAAFKEAVVASVAEGFNFRTHWHTSGSAKKVWERLARKGVARVVEPFVEAMEADDKWAPGQKYAGYYVVDAVRR